MKHIVLHTITYKKHASFTNLPAIFPKAHTACSLMWVWEEARRDIKAEIAPPSTTAFVWSDVPEAILVSAQAASNWIGLQFAFPKKDTNFGIKPALIIWSIGGCFSRDSSFLCVREINLAFLAILQRENLHFHDNSC